MVQLTLTLKMTTAQVVETSVTVNNNSPIQDYVHLNDQSQTTFEIIRSVSIFLKFLELQGVSSGDETLCRMPDITSQTK